VDAAKLAALAKHDEPVVSATLAAQPVPDGEAPKPVDLSKANDKLSGLLGGKKP
jgi:hypothetical protein